MGVVVGALTRARALVFSATFGGSSKGAVAVGHAAVVVIAAVQLTFAYFLMLIAMTYQAELFMMVVFGLAIGVLFTTLQVGRSATSNYTNAPSAMAFAVKEEEGKIEQCC